MAEIKIPQKQSYINRPIGVATTRTGDAEAAQRIASAAQSYASSVSSTVKAAFSAGINIQQNYEMQKFTDWAKTTPVLNENGDPTNVTMPSALSYRTKEQVNSILERRYTEASKIKTSEYLVKLRQEFKNDPDGFNKAASNYASEQAKIIKSSGGMDYSQSYLAQTTSMIGQHYLDEVTKKAAIQDQAASFNYTANVQNKVNEFVSRVAGSGGDFTFALDEIKALKEELNSTIPAEQGLNNSQIQSLINKINKQVAVASLSSQLQNRTAAEALVVVKALSTNVITDEVLKIIPNFVEIRDNHLQDYTLRDDVRSDIQTLQGNISEEETYNARLSTPIAGNGVKAQAYTALVMQSQFGINNEADFIESISNPEDGNTILGWMQTQQAMPNWLISSLDSAANGTSMYSEQAIGTLAEVANQLIYTPNGRLISGGRGMDASTVSFVKTLQGLRTRYSDKNISDLVQMARSVRDDNPEYRYTINKKLGAKSVDQSPTQTIKDYLYAEKNYNPEFVEKYSAVFGQHLLMNGTSNALDFLDTFYDSMYHDYEYSYKYDGGPDRQAYTPEFYYDNGSGGFASYPMMQFNAAADDMVKNIDPNLSLGSDVFLDSDPRNNDLFGKFWAVKADGSRMTDKNGNDVFITTKAIDAMTNIERRNQIAAREREKAIEEENRKTELGLRSKDPEFSDLLLKMRNYNGIF